MSKLSILGIAAPSAASTYNCAALRRGDPARAAGRDARHIELDGSRFTRTRNKTRRQVRGVEAVRTREADAVLIVTRSTTPFRCIKEAIDWASGRYGDMRLVKENRLRSWALRGRDSACAGTIPSAPDHGLLLKCSPSTQSEVMTGHALTRFDKEGILTDDRRSFHPSLLTNLVAWTRASSTPQTDRRGLTCHLT